MSKLSTNDIAKIAHLARIAVLDTELAVLTDDLSNILNFVEQINQIDTSNVTPMAHPLDIYQRLRNDAVTETDIRDLVQSIAPKIENGLYLVPKVIAEE